MTFSEGTHCFLNQAVREKMHYLTFAIYRWTKELVGKVDSLPYSLEEGGVGYLWNRNFFFFFSHKYKSPNYYICINKLLHVCNVFTVFICVTWTPQYSQLNVQWRYSKTNHVSTSVTKKSIPNINRVLDQSLVIRYSTKRTWTTSSKV